MLHSKSMLKRERDEEMAIEEGRRTTQLDEGGEEKSISICIQNSDHEVCWYSISGGISFNQNHDISSSYPPDLRNLISYSFAVLHKSKIFFLGGEIRDSHGHFSNKVFAFDTRTASWDVGIQSMQSARAFHAAVAVKDKIYVFGCSSSRKNLTPQQWAECYDQCTNTWSYLPKPPKEVYAVSDISSHAVNQSRNLILLWVFNRGVYLFDYGSNVWLDYDIQAPITGGPRWSNRVAVVNDVIFWHYFGTIYAYDFTKDKTLPLHTLEDANSKFGERIAPDPHGLPGPTFLLPIGAQRLCLVWLDFFLQDKIYCYKFRFERQGDGSLCIVSEGYVDFPFQGYDIEDVLELEL